MAVFRKPSKACLVLAILIQSTWASLPSIDVGGVHIGPQKDTTRGQLPTTQSTIVPTEKAGESTPTPTSERLESTKTIMLETESVNISSTQLLVETSKLTTLAMGNESVASLALDSNATSTPILTTVRLETVKPAGRPPILSDFECATKGEGYYGNPVQKCDHKFYVCVDRGMNAYEFVCPAKLYFDDLLKVCETWFHIPECSGRPRPTIEIRNETQHTLPTAAPVIDCYKLQDGNYPDPEASPKKDCSNRFFTCAGRREFRFFCPRGLYYDHERNQCDLWDRVYACSGNRVPKESEVTWGPALTLPPVDFSCKDKKDGYYVEKCGSIYYSCNGGLARQFLCPEGLVFDSEWMACEAPHWTFICSGTRRPSTERPISTVRPTQGPTTPSPLNCVGRADDIYRDPEVKCSRKFYYCAHNGTHLNWCPGNLYYDHEYKRCDLWINIFDCSGMRPTTTIKPITVAPSVLPTVDFDCTKIEDGNYANPKEKCSHFFYICAHMEAFQQWCPAGLYYDVELNVCDSWANIFACSGITHRPTEKPTPPIFVSTLKPEFDCSLQRDGVYLHAVNACSGVYYRCVGGNLFKFNCPGGLYYDLTVDRCDLYDYVFACSGKTRPPPTPSTLAPIRPSTEKPPIDCRSLPDGDYPDPSSRNKCGHMFYSCSSGFAIRRECSEKTYYDVDLKICDVYWNVPACSGSPRPVTRSTPTFIRTTGAPLAFDCTKLHDGNYPAGNCSGDFWSCVGGTTFQRRCPLSFIYDEEFDDCEFPHMVPECGGQRITQPPKTPSTLPTTFAGGFSCQFKIDGNYVDPESRDGCSTVYYTCANGIGTRVHCPAGLHYDNITDACNTRERVPACGGSIEKMTPIVVETKAPTTIAKLATTIQTTLSTLGDILTSTRVPVVTTERVTEVPTILTTKVTEAPLTTVKPTEATTIAPTLPTSTQGIITEIPTTIKPTEAPVTTTIKPTEVPVTTTLRPTEATTTVPTTILTSPSPIVGNLETEPMSSELPSTSTSLPVTELRTSTELPTTTGPRWHVITKIVNKNFTEVVTEIVNKNFTEIVTEIVPGTPRVDHVTTKLPIMEETEAVSKEGPLTTMVPIVSNEPTIISTKAP